MTTILLYHVYPINHWKEITGILFQELPFDKIVVHVSLPTMEESQKHEVEAFFQKYPVDDILYSPNSGTGEVDAIKVFIQTHDLKGFDLLTYMHCKGVSKPGNKYILEWTKMMRYFIIEKMSVCKRAFRKGYITFGVNKSIPNKADEGFRNCNFFYEGNFVSLNLKKVNLEQAVHAQLENTYYGLEGFWGKLCAYQEGYSIFNSGINHYLSPISEKDYATSYARFRYSLVKNFWSIKSRLQGDERN
jgi:hypothetical protein